MANPNIVRVYHPRGNAFNDVNAADVAAWEEQGWTRKKPAHVDESDSLPVGEGYVTPKAPKAAK